MTGRPSERQCHRPGWWQAGLTSALAAVALVSAGCSAAGPSASGPGEARSGDSAAPASTSPASAAGAYPTPSAPLGPFAIDYIAVDQDRSVLGSDCWAARVVRIRADGVDVVAGEGPEGFSADFVGDGGLALAAHLACPSGLALSGGRMYLVDHANNRIRVIDRDGVITTLAGSGETGVDQGSFSGDGGSALEATLQEPTFIVLDRAGNVYFSDRDNNRVRHIAPDGLITTVAGNGDDGFSGDGGPAIQATLDDPAGLVIDAQGNLYVADSNNHRIRRIDLRGRITTVAGTGAAASTGDGGPAKAATLTDPESLAIDAAGNLYIGDAGANVVRRVGAHGAITTFAGTGRVGHSGDGGPAAEATLAISEGVAGLAFDAAGNLYIADTGNFCIRMVSPDGTITTYALT